MKQYIYAGLGIAAIGTLVALVIAAAISHQRWVQKCEDNGGRVVKVNCHTSNECHTTLDFNGDPTGWSCEDVEHCDEACDGASPEGH